MRIVFMGTPDFAKEILRALIEAKHEVLAVVTQPDKARDRGKKVQFTPVKELALENGITVHQPEKIRQNEDFLAELVSYNPDVIVVAAYGKILPKAVLELPKYGCLNVHASLLPRLRGAAPIQWSILLGDEKTGVTIMQMAEGLDTGDMLLKGEVEIGKMNYEELHDKLAEVGSACIVEAIRKLEAGELKPEKQDDSLSTYAPMISKQDGEVKWEKTAQEIERLVRGFDPWPGAYTYMKNASGEEITLKIWKADVLEKTAQGECGTVLSASPLGIEIACGEGTVLNVTEIQLPGKKRVDVKSYLLGNKMPAQTKLGR